MKQTIPQSPLWVYVVAILLPFNGGYINAATIVGFLHHAVGYVTGNLTHLGTSFAFQNWMPLFSMLGLIMAFFVGAICSGLLIKSEHFQCDFRYDLSLIVQMILVIGATILLGYQNHSGEFILAAVMGLQNAMTTHYGAAIIRTTHMTGTTTDLGIQVALWLKGERKQAWKIKIYGLLILFFLIGAVAGAIVFTRLGHNGLWLSVGIYLLMIVMHKR